MWACEFLVITFLSVSTSDRECVNNGMLGVNNGMLGVNNGMLGLNNGMLDVNNGMLDVNTPEKIQNWTLDLFKNIISYIMIF
jgi:hypothetical protein